MSNPDSTGWPSNVGPLFDLHRLGLIDNPSAPQSWAPYQKVFITKGSAVVYKASAAFLRADAIRYLAALSFEGYEIELQQTTSSHNIEMRIKVTQ